jgi:hypothetical protein
VAIHESRHDHAPGRIHVFRAAGFRQVLKPAGCADLQQNTVADQEGAIRNQAYFVQRRTASGSSGSAQGEQLAGAPD